KFGYEGRKQDIFNLFVPASDGVYYFDSVADFQAGRANRFEYNNAVTGVDTDAAAAFEFFTHSVFGQDTFEVTDTLRLTAGARLDVYQMEDVPAFNQNFVNRQGFTNQQTFDGKSVFMPRFSFEYEPTAWFDLRGGFGLFSGGLPNVVLSNSFSNTGVLSAGINIERRADGTFEETTRTPGFNQAIGAAALNINRSDPRFGFDIPAAVQAFQGGAVVSPSAETNAISPGFQPPSEYKFFTSASFEAEEGWSDGFAPTWARSVLEGWRLNLDAVVTRVNQGLLFRDFRAQPLIVNGQQQFTPDGRIRYDGLGGTAAVRTTNRVSSTNPGSNRDIVALNTDFGESYTAAVSLTRQFDNGLDVLLGYARQDIEDQTSGARFASTASSLYGLGPAGLDPNEEARGTSFEEIKNRYKAEIGYRRNFFRDFETRLNLFGEVRSGRPISFVMRDDAPGRGPVFGVNRGNHLLFVPDFRSDTDTTDLNVGPVTFVDRDTLNNFRNAVELFGLPQGRILQKGEGSDDQPEVYQLDFQLSQALPGVLAGHRTRLVFDLQNVLNLLNDEWGLVEEYNDTNSLVDVQCATATGAPAAAGSPVCARYIYRDFDPGATRKTIDVNGRSVWALQIRLKYEF
ncbi:MAG: TonB-dependent receptor, partial [Proteobacteria bacterium]|nr:TonB-dependent receptor [Pseudomonadota bacterium]